MPINPTAIVYAPTSSSAPTYIGGPTAPPKPPTGGVKPPVSSGGRVITLQLAPELATTVLVDNMATQPELFWSVASGTFPFARSIEYTYAMRTRWRIRYMRTPEQARQLLQKDVDKALEQFNFSLDELVDATGLDAVGRNVLTMGLALTAAGIAAGIAIGAAAGAGAMGIGALVGGAVGAVVGIVLGLWPFERMDWISKWGRTIDRYEIVERYALLSNFRKVMDPARERARQPAWGPWRMGEQGGFLGLGNNIWGGPDTLAKFAHEELWRRDCIPSNAYPAGHPVVTYALCTQASPLADDRPLEESFLYRLTSDGHGNQWMRGHMAAARRRTAGDLREAAKAAGQLDFKDAPITPEFQTLINNRKRELEAKVLAARRAKGILR